VAGATTLSVFEWFCVAIVLFATFSLQSSNERVDDEDALQLESIQGVFKLSTRPAMDAFGLQEFTVGALASLNLTSTNVVAAPCDECVHSLAGVGLQGEVVITNLLDSNNRQGRVEATVQFTHLYERSPSSFLLKEWFVLHWDSGDASSSVEVFIRHDPPRWHPETPSLPSSFVETDDGFSSRSGSEVLVQNLNDTTKLIRACLPDSFLCRAASGDAVLTAAYGPRSSSTTTASPHEWVKQNLTNVSGPPQETSAGQSMFSLGEEVNSTSGWCPAAFESTVSSVSYEHLQQSVSLAPLSALLYATASIQLLFTPTGEIWTETGFGEVQCSSLTSHDGILNFGIYSTGDI